MKRTALVAMTWLAATAALAAQTKTLSAPPADDNLPSLIHTTVVSSGDSALVRAAKLTAAGRVRDMQRVVINDAYMQKHSEGGHISQGTTSLPSVAPMPSEAPNSGATTATVHVASPERVPGVDRAAVEKEQKELAREHARAATEMDEPYGGNDGMEEDGASARATKTQQQMDQNQQVLNQTQPRPPQE